MSETIKAYEGPLYVTMHRLRGAGACTMGTLAALNQLVQDEQGRAFVTPENVERMLKYGRLGWIAYKLESNVSYPHLQAARSLANRISAAQYNVNPAAPENVREVEHMLRQLYTLTQL